jgi:uncharacterized protein (DUF1697 family)
VPGYAAFLRGINLGKNRRVSGAELRALFEELGFEDVSTFRTSGNVRFSAPKGSVAALTARIEAGLERRLGYEVAVFLRTADELRAIAAHEPFERDVVERSKGKLQVSLLRAALRAEARRRVLASATDADRLAFGKRELYWLPSGGTRDSALDVDAIGKLLGPTTMRTKGTMELLAAKHFAE